MLSPVTQAIANTASSGIARPGRAPVLTSTPTAIGSATHRAARIETGRSHLDATVYRATSTPTGNWAWFVKIRISAPALTVMVRTARGRYRRNAIGAVVNGTSTTSSTSTECPAWVRERTADAVE